MTVVYARAFVDAMNRCLWLSKAFCGHFVFIQAAGRLHGFGLSAQYVVNTFQFSGFPNSQSRRQARLALSPIPAYTVASTGYTIF